MRNYLNIFFLAGILCSFCYGQTIPGAFSKNSFLSNDILNPVDEYYIKHPTTRFHSSLKPYIGVTVNDLDELGIPYKHTKLHNYFLSKNICDTPSCKNIFNLHILPQVNVEQGYDMLYSRNVNETNGGLYIRGDINRKFSIAAQYIAGYITAPNFMDSTIQSYGIVPGMGIAYASGNDTSNLRFRKHSYNNFSGYVSWSPKNFINFQLGKDKHFIGDGYRSLLLSDVATNYPYFKTTLNIWHLQYSAWCSWFYDVSNANGIKKDFQNKFGTFHYLSWNANNNLNISAFENVVWQGTDTNRTRGFDPNYLSPFVFFRPIEYSLGSSDNSMLGFTISYKVARRIKLYGQAVIDEFYLKEIRAQKGWWANKQGFQAGFKYVDAFGIKKLSLQGEFNYVRPFTYSHGSPQQSYTHYNQPLAHPLGANFKEAVGIVSYRHNRYRLDGKLIYAESGRDTAKMTSSNVGQNIFLSYVHAAKNRPYGNYTGQGIKTTFMQAELRYTFYLVADWNLRLEAGLIQRIYKNERNFDRETPFIYAGIKTNLYNSYRDF
ncbi:MAG TPA: hypothetical protein VGF30_01035 [Bacteroidia bacterium]